MYSPDLVERRLFAARKKGLLYQRLPRDRSMEITRRLELLQYNARGDRLPEGQLVRELDEKEHAFIRSERLLCKCDFLYYLSRYHTVERDPGVGSESGIGPAQPLQSQRRLIHLIGKREEVCYREMQKYQHTAGILVYAHKCRQVAFTATSRALTIHRMLFYPGTRCLAATLRDVGELYKRDLLALQSLPFWLRPTKDQLYPNVKDEEIGLTEPFRSRLQFMAENQDTGIGTGTQQDVSHLTEVPLWSYPHRIRYSFVPSLPKAITTLHIQEGTSAGKGGYWHEVTEACRHRRKGFEDYIYVFVPWWMNTQKYRKNPPDDWSPDEHSIKHADLVERSSPEFNDGVTYRLTKPQLYWYETERALHAQNGETAAFLSNYPATPEQSFVNYAQGALPLELIEEMEFGVRPPMPYEVTIAV